MTKFDKLVQKIMDEALADGEPVTREEAEEMAKMEVGAKECKRYEQATVEKKKVKREIKKDPDKVGIISFIFEAFDNVVIPNETDGDHCMRNMAIKNDQREITFNYNGAEYSLTLTKHRPTKKKEG